jgi:hypothetical protein
MAGQNGALRGRATQKDASAGIRHEKCPQKYGGAALTLRCLFAIMKKLPSTECSPKGETPKRGNLCSVAAKRI